MGFDRSTSLLLSFEGIADVIRALFRIRKVIALVSRIEEESLPDQHPRSQKPHQIKNHKDPQLISMLATHLGKQMLKRSQFELVIISSGCLVRRPCVVLNREYGIFVLIMILVEGLGCHDSRCR